MAMQTHWLDILPLIVLAAGGLLIFATGAFLRRHPPWLLFGLSFLTVLGAGLAAILVAPGSADFFGLVDLGIYSQFFTILLLTVTLLTLLFLHRYSQVRGFAGDELFALIIYAALGMVLIAGAKHWLIFFLGLELLSISLYVLIAIRRQETMALEAGVKYFILGAVASAFLTFGIALLYAATGTLEINASLAGATHAEPIPFYFLALSLIFVGIGFKTSLVPFHLWTPDVYEAAPAPVTAFLSTGSKVALFAALLRFALNLTAPAWEIAWPALWVLAVLTMVVGNITAVYQTRIKRLLAYSSVAQMGYLLMALVAVKQGSLPALLFYLAVYALMDLGAFGMLGTLSEPQADLDELADFQGLGYSHPWRSAIFGLCLISLAGLPPTAGFLGKIFLFWAVIQANFIILAVIGISTVVISIYFYFKVLVSLYMRPPSRELLIPPADFAVRLAAGIIFILIVWLGVNPNPLLSVIEQISVFLLQ
jgi:NADH-quinone oxidoreductase subunit N